MIKTKIRYNSSGKKDYYMILADGKEVLITFGEYAEILQSNESINRLKTKLN